VCVERADVPTQLIVHDMFRRWALAEQNAQKLKIAGYAYCADKREL